MSQADDVLFTVLSRVHCLKSIPAAPPHSFYLLKTLHISTVSVQTLGGSQPTRSNSLPPEREGRSGLDVVAEDGAVIVHPRCPGERSTGLCHLHHPAVHRGARGTWKHRIQFTRTRRLVRWQRENLQYAKSADWVL